MFRTIGELTPEEKQRVAAYIQEHQDRLELKKSLVDIVDEQQDTNHLYLLPIVLVHILGLAELSSHHQDPFDRMLISRAIHEGIPIRTKDVAIKKYPVEVIW